MWCCIRGHKFAYGSTVKIKSYGVLVQEGVCRRCGVCFQREHEVCSNVWDVIREEGWEQGRQIGRKEAYNDRVAMERVLKAFQELEPK